MAKITIRPVYFEEIGKILEIENDAWGEAKAATRDMFVTRLETFPEGFFCATIDREIKGLCVQEIINIEDFKNTDMSWNTLTDNGYLLKTHNPAGRSLYGVSISVPPYVSDKRVALALYEYCGKLAIKYNLDKIYTGSRIPKYYKYANKMSVHEYVYARTQTGRILDPELALYVSMGMKIEKIIPNYFNDPESLNYGVLVSWANPLYPFTKHSKLLARALSALFRI